MQNCRSICILLLLSTTHAHFHQTGNLLHASGMTEFPNGSFGNVQVINFINNNFSKLQTYSFYARNFDNLETAFLRNNNIKAIDPYTFRAMFKLLHLDLYENKLTSFQTNTFEDLKSLKTLCLGNNKIKSLQENVFKPLKSLQTLDLSNNQLTALNKTFLKQTPILELKLNGNKVIFSKGGGGILESSTLMQLFLQSCNLSKLPKGAFDLLPNLGTLDLSRNKLQMLPEGLFRKTPKLQYLDISFNLISNLERDIFYLPTNLDVLYCNGNPLRMGLDCVHLLVLMHNNNGEMSVETSNGKDEEINHKDDRNVENVEQREESVTEPPYSEEEGLDKTIYKKIVSLFNDHEEERIQNSHKALKTQVFIQKANSFLEEDNDEEEMELKGSSNGENSGSGYGEGDGSEEKGFFSNVDSNQASIDKKSINLNKEEERLIKQEEIFKMEANNAIVFSIMVISISCFIFLTIIISEICYSMKQHEMKHNKYYGNKYLVLAENV